MVAQGQGSVHPLFRGSQGLVDLTFSIHKLNFPVSFVSVNG